MLFKEYLFILFLPTLIMVVRNLSGKKKETFLGLISIAFFLYYGVESLLAVFSIFFLTYIFAFLIKNSKRHLKNYILILGISSILSIVFIFRLLYEIQIIGASYYMLMAISYLIRVGRGEKGIKNLIGLWFSLSYFPLMVQGPISDLYEIREEALKKSPKLTEEDFFRYLNRIILGYFKIFVIADRLAPFLSLLFKNDSNKGFSFVITLMIYSLRLIMDFTGGIDLVIGISGFMGIKLKENFNKPLFASSLSDFWKRWHISLSFWFSTYVFYPLSLSLMKMTEKKGFRKKTRKRIAVYLASLVTWSLTGLWHGFHLSFLFWGLSNAVILLFSYELRETFPKFFKNSFYHQRVYLFFAMFRTYLIVSLLRAFDHYTSPLKVMEKFFSGYGNMELFEKNWKEANLNEFNFIVLLCCSVAVFVIESKKEKIKTFSANLILNMTLVLFIILFGAYGKGFQLSGFIYGGF